MKPFDVRGLDMPPGIPAVDSAEDSLLSLLSSLSSADPGKVMMRHKRGGIWRSWTRCAMFDLVRRQAATLAERHVGPGVRVAVVGENQPELYAAIIAVQALGADVMPIGIEFLSRFGMPAKETLFAVVADEIAAGWWQGDKVFVADLDKDTMLDDLSSRPVGQVVLHDAGRNAAPAENRYDLSQLRALARPWLSGLVERARLISFLPISSVEDISLSLIAPLTQEVEIHCVEGPGTFLVDLREVAPDALIGPARMWELIDREVSRRLGGGNKLLSNAKSDVLFVLPLKNSLGLLRCRQAIVSSGVVAPGVLVRMGVLGIELDGNDVPDPGAVLEATLRDDPLIDRARVWRDEDGLHAELSTRPEESARLIDEAGEPALQQAINRICESRSLVDWKLRDGGFPAHELTLCGDTRHVSTVLSSISAAVTQQVRETPTNSRVLMEAQGVSLAFGGIKALTDVSMEVREGEILSIIGPNGAGKTSFLNTLNGIYTPQEGSIVFNGKARSRMRPAEAAASGIGRTFQHVALFPGLNVIENIIAGRAGLVRYGFPGVFIARALRLPSVVLEESAQRKAAEEILDFLDLAPIRNREVSTLPYGVQKRVELGRALAGQPSILLLDEPMAGMTHEEKQDMCRFIRAANIKLGTTIVLIEHDIGVVMGLSDRVVVLNYGRKIADGCPAEVRADPGVIRAYLGTVADIESMEG